MYKSNKKKRIGYLNYTERSLTNVDALSLVRILDKTKTGLIQCSTTCSYKWLFYSRSANK